VAEPRKPAADRSDPGEGNWAAGKNRNPAAEGRGADTQRGGRSRAADTPRTDSPQGRRGARNQAADSPVLGNPGIQAVTRSPGRATVVTGAGHGSHTVGPRSISQRAVRGTVFAVESGAARSVWAMAELKSRLRADLTDAMKTQDKLRTATLRMLLAAIQTEEVSGKQARELSDDDVLKVLAREARKRSEAAEIYTQNGRGELAANEHAEARVIDEYLPAPLTEAELADVVDTAIAQVAEQVGERPGMKQMGLVMKAATALAAGKADGARLSAAVKDRL
jgi:uncharacterized protein